MPVLLVRHAHAGSRHAWNDDDADRPLSVRGWRQAQALVAPLARLAPVRLASSPYLRCRQTLEPLGTHLAVRIDDDPALAEGAGAAAVDLVRRSLGETSVVLCSHGDVIPEVLAVLAGDGLDLGPAPAVAKGSVWALYAEGGRFVRAEYLPPGA